MGGCSATQSEEGALSMESLLRNDDHDYGGSSKAKIALKKGPWTSAEDEILVGYVNRHGEGNWNAIQKHTGLLRCGKSCRLRWANHLRPNLKKGAFASEEERLIIELHAKMGNKWAQMAAHLPGRTDNEIKNYWNTRVKRCQRTGLPLYPPELCIQASSDQQQLSSPGIYGEDEGNHDILQSSVYKTPDAMADSFSIPQLTAISAPGSTINGFSYPQFHSFAPQHIGLQKFAREPDETMSDYECGAAIEASLFDRTQTDNCANKMLQSFGRRLTHEPDWTRKLLPYSVDQDTHFVSNPFFSASRHFAAAQKLELPSNQYQEAGLGVWYPAPKSLDSFAQSPLSMPLMSYYPPPQSSGLLQDLVYEAKSLNKFESHSSNWAGLSNISPGDITQCSALKTCSTECIGHLDPSSQSNNSMGLIFNGCTPADTTRVYPVKSEEFDQTWILDRERKEISNHLNSSMPDAIHESIWDEQSASYLKQQFSEADGSEALIGDDFGTESNTFVPASVWDRNSWNSMPAICQVSDNP